MGEKETMTSPLARPGGEIHDESPSETGLLAHELTHTAQQGSGSGRKSGSIIAADVAEAGGPGAADDPSGLAVSDEGKGGQKDPPKTK